eukprot:Nk52_evm63s151 gene=Nk52_evmTU63s151
MRAEFDHEREVVFLRTLFFISVVGLVGAQTSPQLYQQDGNLYLKPANGKTIFLESANVKVSGQDVRVGNDVAAELVEKQAYTLGPAQTDTFNSLVDMLKHFENMGVFREAEVIVKPGDYAITSETLWEGVMCKKLLIKCEDTSGPHLTSCKFKAQLPSSQLYAIKVNRVGSVFFENINFELVPTSSHPSMNFLMPLGDSYLHFENCLFTTADSSIFGYFLRGFQTRIHLENCKSVGVRGLIYAENGSMVTITGGEYGGAASLSSFAFSSISSTYYIKGNVVLKQFQYCVSAWRKSIVTIDNLTMMQVVNGIKVNIESSVYVYNSVATGITGKLWEVTKNSYLEPGIVPNQCPVAPTADSSSTVTVNPCP